MMCTIIVLVLQCPLCVCVEIKTLDMYPYAPNSCEYNSVGFPIHLLIIIIITAPVRPKQDWFVSKSYIC